jgi:hypothetical protein
MYSVSAIDCFDRGRSWGKVNQLFMALPWSILIQVTLKSQMSSSGSTPHEQNLILRVKIQTYEQVISQQRPIEHAAPISWKLF